MRYTIFAAALIASTQALKIKNLSEVKAGSKQGEGWCADIHPDFSNMTNELYTDSFDSGIQWYDNMGPFWQVMNGSAAFYWFDCEHGNGDGKVSYDEFAAGLADGYVEDMQCYDHLHSQWGGQSGSENINVAKSDYRKAQWNIYRGIWKAITGEKSAQNVTFTAWMNGASETHALDVREAAVLWNQMNNGTYSWKIQNATVDQFNQAIVQDINAQVDWFRSQYVLIENALVLEPMWYFTQQCFDPASYWFALVRDPNTYAWDSTVEFDYDQFMDQICNNWELCEQKMS